ncbi:MAG: penicillin-binding protein 2, partial [Actinomycetota bacterium]
EPESSPRPVTKRANFRLLSLLGAFIVCLALLLARLVFVQAIDSARYHALAANQRERRIILAPQRGSIFDRDGSELAMSLEMKSIYANPRFIADPAGAAAQLAPVLGMDVAVLIAKLSRSNGFVYLARKVDPGVAEKVAALGIPGVESVAESKRFYPAGALGAQVLGFVGADNAGLGGLEGRYDRILKGSAGEILMERDPNGRPIPRGRSLIKPPTSGDDIVLTIDREIQFAAEESLARAVSTFNAKAGIAIVMNPSTGEILAMANVPSFDPNDVEGSDSAMRKNRALVDIYEPGSANKVILASAVIEEGVTSASDVMSVADNYRIGNKIFHDAHPHPTENMTFAAIIQKSSNVGTIKTAQKLGKGRLYEYLARFGYGKPTGLDFPGEAAGILPKPDSWSSPSMGTIPIGQGVAVTGMQILSVFSTIANDGVAVQPRLVRATIDGQGKRRLSPSPATHRVISAATAKKVTAILAGVTEGEDGTGHMAAIAGYQVAGKTGTAQKPLPGGGGYGGYIGSFVGYAPAGDPQLAVAVILDEPSPIWGGVTAAPTFKEIMQFSLRHLGIGPALAITIEGKPLLKASSSSRPVAD